MAEQAVQLSNRVRAVIDDWVKKYPADQKQSAVLTALLKVQHENHGYINTAMMDAVAEYLDMPKIAVYEVASFYSMLETDKVGRHSISVCTNISCMLSGADEIVRHLENKLGIKTGHSTADGCYYLKCEEECLAACCGAPMMMVDHIYYENLTPAKVDKILAALDD